MLISVGKASDNPTIKEETRATGKGIMSLGMLNMPVSQASDILAFNADIVACGRGSTTSSGRNKASCKKV